MYVPIAIHCVTFSEHKFYQHRYHKDARMDNLKKSFYTITNRHQVFPRVCKLGDVILGKQVTTMGNRGKLRHTKHSIMHF